MKYKTTHQNRATAKLLAAFAVAALVTSANAATTIGINFTTSSGMSSTDLDTRTATVTVTNIPFALYDVYAYRNDDGPSRGGRFTIGATTYYISGGAGSPTNTGTGYVLSTDTTAAQMEQTRDGIRGTTSNFPASLELASIW